MSEVRIDQYLYDITSDVKSLTDPFLKSHGLNYFQYCSVFSDDTSTFLVTHPDFVKARVNRKRRILSHIDAQSINEQTYVFLWNESLPKEDTDMARDYGIDHGLCFVERYSNHYNLIAFGAPSGRKNTASFYLNNLQKLWQFVQEFRAQGGKIIEKATQKRFVVPDFHQDVNCKRLLLADDRRQIINYEGISLTLSDRELQCLQLLARGFTMKKISEQLGISARTVETYLERTKNKIGLSSKFQLTQFYYSHCHHFLSS